MLPLRLRGLVPPAAAVVEDVLVHQRHAERVGRTGPSTVITCPDRTCAVAASSSDIASSVMLSRRDAEADGEDAGVQPYRDQDDRARHDLGEERRDMHAG